MIADEVNMNWETVCLILTEELGMRNICAKVVPRNLRATVGSAFERNFLTSKCIMVMLLPSYSPDFGPYAFFLFQKVKLVLKGLNFKSTEDIQRSVTQALNDIPKNTFQKCYKHWQHHLKRCVEAQGIYFEGDHIVVDEKIK
jgi:hypothetical protein